ncbi:SH3 domain-containing protein 19-like [Glandiceps talaboti]
MGSFIKEIESLYTKPPSPQTVDQQSSDSTSAIATPVVKPPLAGSPAVKPLPPPSSGSSTARPTIIRPTTAKSKGGPPPRPSGGPKVSSGSTAASLLDMPIPDTDVHTDTLKKSSSTSALGRAQSMRTAPARPSDQPKKKAPAPPRPSPMTKGPPKPPRSAPGIPGTSQPRGAPNLPPRPEPGHPLYKYMVTEPHGIAVFPYSKQNYDELSFDKDDVIILLRKVDEDWLFGRNVDDEGMFPKKFIKIVRALPGESPGKVEGPCAVGVYDYYSNAPDDLTFNKDDFIKLLSRVGDDWYKGECNGEIGMFPKNYVEVLEDLPEEKEEIKPDTLSISLTLSFSGPRCRARFDFEAEGENDLDFEEGDVIRLIEPVGQEWMKGELNGKTGIFPLEFVEIIEHLPETTKAMSMPRGFAAPAAEIVVTPPTPVSDDNVVSALYDFDGMNSTELSFKTGDRIKVTNQVNEEWLIGECNGQKGRFPSNFIESIPANLPPEDTTVSSTQVDGGSHCIAKYDYEAASSDDLDFKEGDKIILLERISDDWYKGSCHGKEGMFPKAFVDVVEDLPKDISSKRSSTRQRGGSFEELMPKAEALHDFTGETSGELTFKAGDVIYLLEKVNDDWYSGELKGSVGQFPVGFVEIIIPLPGAGGL